MRYSSFPFSILTIFLSLTFLSNSQTVIPGGEVSGLWTLTGSPYLVMGDITIPNDSTLAIDPGVLVVCQGHFALHVQGRLLAIGTEADTIFFAVNDTTGFFDPDTTLGGWNGIKFIDTPLQNDTSKIVHCKLQYGKAVGSNWWLNTGGAVCLVNFGKVLISHSVIIHNSAGGPEAGGPAGGGIYLGWSDAAIINNTFSYNKALAGGAIQIYESNPYFSNNTFIGNTAQEGGGINIQGINGMSFNGDSFNNNISSNHGGGIMCWNSQNLSLNNVTFAGNVAFWGGGLGIGNGSATLANCVFENNKAYSIGGGMAADFCELTISNSSFANDSSFSISGALHNWHCNTEIYECLFTNNYAVLGGAIYSDLSSVEINHTIFNSNSANDGGALRMWCSSLVADSVIFEENFVYNQGGALEYIADTGGTSESYQLKIYHSQFIRNTANSRCGAARIEQLNTENSIIDLAIDGCWFDENSANRIGALMFSGKTSGIVLSNTVFKYNSSDQWTGCMTFNNESSGKVYNCLYYYNSAGSGSTGAAGSSFGSNVDFINCTFAGNSSGTGGGLHVRRGSVAKAINCIFWGNSPNQISLAAITDSTPCFLYMNYCDIQFGHDSIKIEDAISTVNWGLGNIADQPSFADILNEDFALSSYSPCIGAGIDTIEIEGSWLMCPEFDLLGNPRPNPLGTLPDMGAIESPLPDTTGFIFPSCMVTHPSKLNAFPNPFSQSLFIEYTLTQLGEVHLAIYNQMGEMKKRVSGEIQTKGNHTLEVDCTDLMTGIYFCSLVTSEGIRSIKLLKIK